MRWMCACAAAAAFIASAFAAAAQERIEIIGPKLAQAGTPRAVHTLDSWPVTGWCSKGPNTSGKPDYAVPGGAGAGAISWEAFLDKYAYKLKNIGIVKPLNINKIELRKSPSWSPLLVIFPFCRTFGTAVISGEMTFNRYVRDLPGTSKDERPSGMFLLTKIEFVGGKFLLTGYFFGITTAWLDFSGIDADQMLYKVKIYRYERVDASNPGIGDPLDFKKTIICEKEKSVLTEDDRTGLTRTLEFGIDRAKHRIVIRYPDQQLGCVKTFMLPKGENIVAGALMGFTGVDSKPTADYLDVRKLMLTDQ